jgi:hypothetical protein
VVTIVLAIALGSEGGDALSQIEQGEPPWPAPNPGLPLGADAWYVKSGVTDASVSTMQNCVLEQLTFA